MFLKVILAVLASISGVYLAGDMVRQNAKLDALLTDAEQMFAVLNRKVSAATVGDGLRVLQSVYGVLAVAFVLLLTVVNLVRLGGADFRSGVAVAALTALALWVAILWCRDHKRVLATVLPNVSLLVFGPVAIGVMDVLLGSNFASILAASIAQALQLAHVGFHPPSSPIILGVLIAVVVAVLLTLQYVLAWLVCFPVAFVAALFAAATLALANAIDTAFPKKPFVGLVVLVFLSTSIALVVCY